MAKQGEYSNHYNIVNTKKQTVMATVLAFIEIMLIKRHYRDNIEYCDILTHENRHQLFLISQIPTTESPDKTC